MKYKYKYKYVIIYNHNKWYIQKIELLLVNYKHKFCGLTDFYYKGYIINKKFYNTTREAIKELAGTSKPIIIKDII